MKLTYRPEIDGLRAIAVLAVVLYHAEFVIFGSDPFTGGYIGVDVFFVISGYLITSIIVREIHTKSFSFQSFYERRARRILPALFTVMVATLPFAWLYLLPKAMKEYAGSLLSSLFFGSNIWFWLEDSYTAEPSALKPLLHTWSLSVEEQFYVLFPPFLLLVWRYAKAHVLAVLLVGFVVSLYVAQTGSTQMPEAAFFLLPFRGWELLAGAILAILELQRGRAPHGFAAWSMPILGLGLITLAVLVFDEQTQHPSYVTLVPVVGAMLLIWFCDPDSALTRFLGSRVFVGLGLISYSFYLWHFPVFAFSRIGGVFASNTEKIAMTAAALIVSIISYYCIEKPARNPSTIARRPFFIVLFVVFAALVSVSVLISKLDGIPGRLGVFSNLFEEAAIERVTQGDRACRRFSDQPCRFLMPDATSTLISVGDSQAAAISAQLLKSAQHNNANFVQLTQAACLLIKGTTRFDDNRPHEKCQVATAFANEFLENAPPATIVYTGRFPLQINGERYDNGEGGVEPGPSPRLSTNDSARTIIDASQQMIRGWLDHGHTVVLVYPIPEVGWNLPKLVASKISALADDQLTRDFPLLRHLNITTSYSVFAAWAKPSVDMLDGVGQYSKLLRVYPVGIFCNENSQRCLTHDQQHFYYSDDNHLSGFGARLLVAEIEAVLGWEAGSDDQHDAPQYSE